MFAGQIPPRHRAAKGPAACATAKTTVTGSIARRQLSAGRFLGIKAGDSRLGP